jgi:predicted nicotinamide N-methyase
MTFVAVVLAMTAADQNAELRIRTIVQGTDSRIAVHRELVIRTPGWWQFIWHEHRGSFEPPPIDFSRQMIVAVFGGSAGAGSSIEIIAAVREGASIVVRYREQLRPRDAKSLRPFHIVAIPADRSTVTFVRLTAS